MMRIITTPILLLLTTLLNSQSILDTVSLGPSYANQVWYSLDNDEQGSEPKNNWDLSFDVSGFGTSIHTNSANGVLLWNYPMGDTAHWSTLDTTGITGWTQLYNSDSTWSLGAADRGTDPSNQFDVGWGVYNPITHIISGDSLFVIKLSNGAFKKLWIINVAGGGYNFKYADIDGTNEQTYFLSKSNYTGKNFGYYSIENNTELNREDVNSTEWDLLFTQYTTFIPSPYNVAGVLSNKDVEVAQVDDLDEPLLYNDWSQHNMIPAINEIGYDWKAFTGAWMIESDRVYFIRSRPGDIWKVVFTGFGGSGNGHYIFTKEKLSTVSIDNSHKNLQGNFAIYPDPTHNQEVTIALDLTNTYSEVEINLYDMSGRLMMSKDIQKTSGLHFTHLNLNGIDAGVYLIQVMIDGQSSQKKLVVN